MQRQANGEVVRQHEAVSPLSTVIVRYLMGCANVAFVGRLRALPEDTNLELVAG